MSTNELKRLIKEKERNGSSVLLITKIIDKLVELQDLDEIPKYLEELSLFDEAKEKFYFYKGMYSLFIEEFNDSIVNLKKSLEIDPDQVTAYLMLSEGMTALGMFDEAVELLDNFVELNEGNLEIVLLTFHQIAEIAFRNEQLEVALEKYKMIESLIEIDEVISYQTGVTLFFLERYEEAIYYLDYSVQKALEKNKEEDTIFSTNYLSKCYYELKDYKRALEYNNTAQDIYQEASFYDELFENLYLEILLDNAIIVLALGNIPVCVSRLLDIHNYGFDIFGKYYDIFAESFPEEVLNALRKEIESGN